MCTSLCHVAWRHLHAWRCTHPSTNNDLSYVYARPALPQLLGLVVVAVGCIFVLRVLLTDDDRNHQGFIPVGWPEYITSIVNG